MLKSGAFMAVLPCMAEAALAGVVKVTHPALDRLSRSISLAWNPRLLRVRPSARRVIDVFFRSGTGIAEEKSIRIHAKLVLPVVVQGNAVEVHDRQQIQ